MQSGKQRKQFYVTDVHLITFSGAQGTLLVVTFSQTPCDEFLDVFFIFCAVYPPLAEMTEEDKNNSWKPGQRKKKSEKVDSTWNPKSK